VSLGEPADGQLASERHREHQPPDLGRQPQHPRADEILQRVRQRDLVSDLREALRAQHAPELEREQRVPARGVGDPQQ
jgi:hypothetical protein